MNDAGFMAGNYSFCLNLAEWAVQTRKRSLSSVFFFAQMYAYDQGTDN